MKSRVLPCLLVLLPMACSEAGVPPAADERVTLSSPRRDYLLGEPVLLELSFRNRSEEVIKVMEVFVEGNYYEVPIWISREGERFREFRPSYHRDKRKRGAVDLAPGEALKYHYRVIGGAPRGQDDFQLAFPKPGPYRVYATYGSMPSNVVEVRVTQPVGEDAKVWRQLNDPLLLWLLQVEDLGSDEQEKAFLRKLVELLHAHPKSGYAPALRHFLAKVAPPLRDHLSFDEATRLGEVLGIKDFARVEDDPKDKRLDALRKDSYEKSTVADVLKSLSKASGVPLDAPHEYKLGTMSMADLTTVRECMQAMRGNGHWERRGNGYFLVPQKPPEAKKADGDKP